MSKIFICYRRDDSEGYTGRLYDRLVQRFGKERVFLDIADIPAGTDFLAYIRSVIRECSAMLVVIGPQWLAPAPGGSKPRLHATGDHVRLEIVEAFRSGLTVIPVLVQRARMPQAAELPRGTVPLSRRNAVEIGARSFDADCRELFEALEKLERASSPDVLRPTSEVRRASDRRQPAPHRLRGTLTEKQEAAAPPPAPSPPSSEADEDESLEWLKEAATPPPAPSPPPPEADEDESLEWVKEAATPPPAPSPPSSEADEDESLESFREWLNSLRR